MHRLLLPSVFLGLGRFQGKLYDLGSYPAAIASDNPASLVHGEVYLLQTPVETLAALDRYEGCALGDPAPHEYVRTSADIQLDSSARSVIPAQIYLYNRPCNDLTRIEPGDYLQWLARRFSPPTGA